jgi:heme-degrading monooxygenase HmoA
MTFLSVWEYVVPSARRESFERVYGPEGDWARLFRRASGYIRTELHHDRDDAERYLTLDYWESAAAWEAFRAGFAREYEALDARAAELTTRETALGRFERVG